jgi:hypothetical protein
MAEEITNSQALEWTCRTGKNSRGNLGAVGSSRFSDFGSRFSVLSSRFPHFEPESGLEESASAGATNEFRTKPAISEVT